MSLGLTGPIRLATLLGVALHGSLLRRDSFHSVPDRQSQCQPIFRKPYRSLLKKNQLKLVFISVCFNTSLP